MKLYVNLILNNILWLINSAQIEKWVRNLLVITVHCSLVKSNALQRKVGKNLGSHLLYIYECEYLGMVPLVRFSFRRFGLHFRMRFLAEVGIFALNKLVLFSGQMKRLAFFFTSIYPKISNCVKCQNMNQTKKKKLLIQNE